ncbi:hypothetical protein KCP70_24020 [Salmonella enterica subsp. enterica]|nr:hypothetical protein KCP70_24020 [Salmonella enterica subsp. enterica]
MPARRSFYRCRVTRVIRLALTLHPAASGRAVYAAYGGYMPVLRPCGYVLSMASGSRFMIRCGAPIALCGMLIIVVGWVDVRGILPRDQKYFVIWQRFYINILCMVAQLGKFPYPIMRCKE